MDRPFWSRVTHLSFKPSRLLCTFSDDAKDFYFHENCNLLREDKRLETSEDGFDV